jgi:hypothetical protein
MNLFADLPSAKKGHGGKGKGRGKPEQAAAPKEDDLGARLKALQRREALLKAAGNRSDDEDDEETDEQMEEDEGGWVGYITYGPGEEPSPPSSLRSACPPVGRRLRKMKGRRWEGGGSLSPGRQSAPFVGHGGPHPPGGFETCDGGGGPRRRAGPGRPPPHAAAAPRSPRS